MSEKKIVLDRLLDKYEQSVHFGAPGRSNRRVLIKTAGRELPEYDYQNAGIRDVFNSALHELTAQNVVFVQWLPGRKRLVAKEIWLNLENLDAAYRLAERVPLSAVLQDYCKLMRESAGRIGTAWLKAALAAEAGKLDASRRLSGIYKKGPAHFSDILHAWELFDRLEDGGMSVRAFSIACYRDSKYFEKNVRDDFLALAREYYAPLTELLAERELNAREQLSLLGLYARPEIYEFAGPLAIETEAGLCDCAPLSRFGCALTGAAAEGVKKLHLGKIRRVMLIENKTNYDEYIEKARRSDELVLFHGGFLSPQKRRLVIKIVSSCVGHTDFFFWADIDLGGFRMFAQLKEIVPELVPWRMGPEEVERYAALGLERGPKYMERLKCFAASPEGALFADTIRALSRRNVTIEQEVMLSDL